MFRSFRLGRLFGFPIDVNLSFLFLLGIVALTMGGLTGVAVVLLAFGSVVLHELGHALVARHLGVRVAGIELHFFGGAARIVDVPRRAGDEIAIAAAGPAVSFALAGIAHLLGGIGGAPGAFFQLLGWINLVIGAFNLIPALPMDGGRILRAVLARRMSYLRATEISVKVARVFAVALAVYGVATLQLYLALLAVVLWFMSTAELTAARTFGIQYRDQPDVEVLPRGASWGGRAGSEPGRAARHRPFWSGGFVVRRYGNRFTIEPID
ncbi:MAG TPA: site-2 protease family protein [Kofleriaceae bacterium]|nr:site-2 protease family protein [Kofleriaceae bacterium]